METLRPIITIVTSLILIFNIVFVFTFHPLAIIIVLIIQCLLIALGLMSITQFPWFSYTLILVFLGGILILFTYIANIASNEKFSPRIKVVRVILALRSLRIFLPKLFISLSKESSINVGSEFLSVLVVKPFQLEMLPLVVLMAGLILLALLGVVKIRKINSGPLRII